MVVVIDMISVPGLSLFVFILDVISVDNFPSRLGHFQARSCTHTFT